MAEGLHEILLRIAKDEEARVTRALAAATPRVADRLRPEVESAFRSTAEYGRLADGELRTTFGLSDGRAAAESVAAAVAASVRGRYDAAAGEARFTAFRKDFEDALEAEGARYTSFSRRRLTSTLVPWLGWYLFEGGSTQAPGYGLVYRARGPVRKDGTRAESTYPFKSSRTGPLMLPLRGGIKRPFVVPTGGGGWIDRVAAIARPRLIAIVEDEARKLVA